MVEFDFDIAWDAFYEGRKHLPIEAELRSKAEANKGDILKINYFGPGGGNPQVFVRFISKSRARAFLIDVLLTEPYMQTPENIEDYVEPILRRVEEE